MMKPSSRSSVARALFRAAPLALMLLAAFGLFVSGCGDDPPTTPTPTPPPAPPAPEPPAVPTGLQVASTGPDYIEWSWTAVEGATGYDIQMSLTAGDFSNSQQEAGTTTSHRFTVAAETTAHARVRAKNADGESDWSATVSGTSMAAPIVLTAPTNLRVTETEPRSITWAWDLVTGASGYEVEMSLNDEVFTPADRQLTQQATANPQATFEVSPETVAYARVRAVAGTGAERVEGPWTLAFRGESEQLPLTAPSGLEVSGRGTDYIEWSWDAVEGATTYDAQISLEDANFSPPSNTFLGLTGRSHRVPNLDPNDVVYMRVRARAGTRQSEWGTAVRGQTEPPPVVPLTTPAGLSASGATRTTVSLDWNDVTDADHYEVEQRAAGGTWGDATCRATDDNEPSTSACVATELQAGTAYGFRVRAIPADDADLQSASAWATASATTTGSVGSGGGALKVRWRSGFVTDHTQIIWNWTSMGTYFEYKVLDSVQRRDVPCDHVTDPSTTFASSLTVEIDHEPPTKIGTSKTRLLCVRTLVTEDDGKEIRGDWSSSWAVTPPPKPGVASENDPRAGVRFKETNGFSRTGGEVSKLKYIVGFSDHPEEFKYEFRFDADQEEKTNDDWPTSDPTGLVAQRQCESMEDAKETVTPGDSTTYETGTPIRLVPYATYRMCYRASNEEGRSAWAHEFPNEVRYTRPLPPSVPKAKVRTGTNANGETESDGTNFLVYWEVEPNADAPQADDTAAEIKTDYNFWVVHTAGSEITTDAGEDAVQEFCEDDPGTGQTEAEFNAASTDLKREIGTSSAVLITPNKPSAGKFIVGRVYPTSNTARRYYYLCAQAKDPRGTGQAFSKRGGGTSRWKVSDGLLHPRSSS